MNEFFDYEIDLVNKFIDLKFKTSSLPSFLVTIKSALLYSMSYIT